MIFILIGVITVAIVYGIVILLFCFSKNDLVITDYQPKISIIIVARNEAENIYGLIESLSRLKYPNHLVEILLMDDSSEDSTVSLINSHKTMLPFDFSLFLANDYNLIGKKKCVSFLTSVAKGEILLFTDADCVLNSNWIEAMINPFASSKKMMVCGAVHFSNNHSFIEKILALEFAALIQITFGSISRKFPFMCNAANMAIRSDVFRELKTNINHKLQSGDDVFLLKSVVDVYGPDSVAFCPQSLVSTSSSSSIASFLNQRIRWAGKSSKSFWINSFVMSMIVLFMSLTIIFLGVMSIAEPHYIIVLLIFFLYKWGIDTIVLLSYQRYFKLFRWWLGLSVILSVVYPVYVVIVAVLSIKKSYMWKGRMVG
ncbi:MAG: glycosyltransferase [Bacteroidota bacterium]